MNTDIGKYWLGSDDNYYYHFTTIKNHEMAKYKCLSEGASLITINRPETQEFLRQKYGGVNGLWLSANDLKGGDYRWEFADGSTECISEYTSNWMSNEPNLEGEHCVIVRNGDQWADVECGSTFEFLCQILKPEYRKSKLRISLPINICYESWTTLLLNPTLLKDESLWSSH